MPEENTGGKASAGKQKESSLGRKYWSACKDYLSGCVNPENSRLYGNFQERAALNITQFPKIQGSLLIRMGLVYPVMSKLVEYMGVPKECADEIYGVAVNYHTWLAGYLAYLSEIQLGMSKYPMEWVSAGIDKVRKNLTEHRTKYKKQP